MKEMILILLLAPFAHASKPVIGINDLAYSKGTGVEKVQFLIGGPEEEMTGAVDQEAVRRVFRTSMLGTYRCFSQHYGADSEKTGRMIIRMTLTPGVRRPKVDVQTTDFDSKEFLSCVQEHWRKTQMVEPADGKTAVVIMPILARLRSVEK